MGGRTVGWLAGIETETLLTEAPARGRGPRSRMRRLTWGTVDVAGTGALFRCSQLHPLPYPRVQATMGEEGAALSDRVQHAVRPTGMTLRGAAHCMRPACPWGVDPIPFAHETRDPAGAPDATKHDSLEHPKGHCLHRRCTVLGHTMGNRSFLGSLVTRCSRATHTRRRR